MVVGVVTYDGESNWMEGLLLPAVCVILGIAFYHLPAAAVTRRRPRTSNLDTPPDPSLGFTSLLRHNHVVVSNPQLNQAKY